MKLPALLKRFGFLAIPVIVFAVYSSAVDGEFVFDDKKLVLDNPALGSWNDLLAAFNVVSDRWEDENVRINYRPVRFLSYGIDAALTRHFRPEAEKLTPHIFHLHNILLHCINALLVFFLLKSLMERRRASASMAPEKEGLHEMPPDARSGAGIFFFAFLALFWALHPVQTEAVTYISGRRDVLFTLFYLSALLLHVREPYGRVSAWKTVLITVLYGTALLTKEMAVTLPASLLLVDILLKRKWRRGRIVRLALVSALGLVYVAFKLGMKNPGGGAQYWGGSFLTAMLTESRAVFRYLWTIIFPFNLSIDWSYAAIVASKGLLAPWTTLLSCVGLLSISAAAVFLLFRKKMTAAFGLCFFIAALLPVMQIVPHPERFAERYLYLPFLGVVLLFVPLFSLFRGLKTGTFLAVMLVLVLSALTYRRNRDWETALSLWESAVRTNPACARAHFACGLLYSDRKNWHQAKNAFDRVFSLMSEKERRTPLEKGFLLQARYFRAQAQTKTAELLQKELASLPRESKERLRRTERVRALYRSACSDYETLLTMTDADGTEIATDPRQASTYFNLASIYFTLEEYPKAERHFETLLQLAPENFFAVKARFWLGMIEMARGRISRGKEKILQAARRAHDDTTRLSFKSRLAEILFKVGKFEEALEMYEAILPQLGHEERVAVKYQVACIYDRLGRRAEAVYLLRQLLIEKPDSVAIKLTLADLEIKEGRWKAAAGALAEVKAEYGPSPEVTALEKQIYVQKLLEEKQKTPVHTPIDVETLLKAGRANMDQNQYKQAADAFRDAYLTLVSQHDDKRSLVALRYFARALDAGGNTEQAVTVLRQGLQKSPNDYRFLKDLGTLLSRSAARDDASFQEAVVVFKKLLATAEDSFSRIEALLALGRLYYQRRQSEQAAGCFDKAAETGTVPPQIHKRRGELHRELERPERAAAAYKSYLETVFDKKERERVEGLIDLLQNQKRQSGGEADKEAAGIPPGGEKKVIE